MTNKLTDRLAQKGLLLLDSAMGTMLQQAGLKSGEQCGELWNIDGPGSEKVFAVHRANVEAGSDIIIANTFGANPLKLARYGAAEQVVEINRAAVKLARDAAGEDTLVAGDIGPTGEILEDWGGTRSRQEIRAAYELQVQGLLEGGVDLVALETFMDLEELLLALEAVRSGSPSMPVLASLTFSRGPGGVRTLWGLTPEQAAEKLGEAGADAVGANCGMGTKSMLEAAGRMAKATSLPVAAQPNAGSPVVSNGETFYEESAEDMAALAPEFKAAGIRLLGGCCGSTPEYILAARNILGL